MTSPCQWQLAPPWRPFASDLCTNADAAEVVERGVAPPIIVRQQEQTDATFAVNSHGPAAEFRHNKDALRFIR